MRKQSSHLDRRRFIALGGGGIAALAMPCLARGASPLSFMEGEAFGTRWSIAAPAPTNLAPMRSSIEAVLADIDLQMSPWRPDSFITRFNSSPAGGLKAPADVATVAQAALSLADQSGGHFDPTVGPLVARWGFGPIAGGDQTGWRGLVAQSGELSKQRDGLTLDLCGIAKGYALDRMANVLEGAGHESFLIELGGELCARGVHPTGRSWQVAIEDPRPGASDPIEIVGLVGLAIATSGNRANGFDLDGRCYSHIIDPVSREPVDSALASVSVIAPDAMIADGWATALMAAGAMAGPELANQTGVTALFLVNENGRLQRTMTGQFVHHLA